VSAHLSAAQILAQLPEDERDRRLAAPTIESKAFLKYHWPFWTRPNQLPPDHPQSDRPDHPGDWLTWLALAGRGFGKTRIASEWIRMKVCGATPSGTIYGSRFWRDRGAGRCEC
jgi:phage terminase large subunit-like protein